MSAHPEGVFARLARLVLRWPSAVAAAAVAITVVAALIGLPPRVDPDLIALLPPDQPHALALAEVSRQTGGINTITLTFDGPDRAVLERTLDALAESLEQLDTVQTALHRIDANLAVHTVLMQHDEHAIDGLTRALEQGADWTDDPIVRALEDPDYLLVPADGRGRIVVKPTHSNVDPAFCERVVDAVHQRIADTDLGSVEHVYSAGPYVFNAASSSGIREDFVRTGGVTVALVLLVLMVGTRSVRTPLLLFVPVAVAGVVNLAIVRVVLGSMNAFTSFGTALLVGLGIDFALHLLFRFRALRADGLAFDDAMATAWGRTGPVCAMAALTSAAGFGVLSISAFRGLGHLGFALCTGLLVSLISMLVLLPLLFRWTEAGEAKRLPALPPTHLTRGAAVWGVGALLVLTGVVAALGARHLDFEYDLTQLNRDHLVFSDMDEATRDLVRQGYPPIVVHAGEEAAVRREHRRLQAALDAGELPHVRRIVSIATLTPTGQAPRIPAFQRLADAARQHGGPAQLATYTPRVWTVADLDPGLRALVGGGTHVLMLPTGDLFDLRESSALIDEIDAVAPGAGSEQLAQGAVFRMILDEAPRFVGLAFLVVAVVVGLTLRRPVAVVVTLVSLVLGMVWAGGLLGVLGIRLTLMNLIGLPILLGLGVDLVLHLAHRLLDGTDVRQALRTVGAAGLLSTLTTMASFVSLMAAGSGGLRSLGALVVVGLATVTVVSGVALVLLWRASTE